MQKKVSIIGLGLIGGSIALDLKKSGFASHIIGVDASPTHRQQALQLGIADEILPLPEAVPQSDLVVAAIPVNALMECLPHVLTIIPPHAVVTDVGSIKSALINAVKNHPNRRQYVPSHPMAGTENSGPAAALHHLFSDKVAVICNPDDSSAEALLTVRSMYAHLEARIVLMDADSHDEHVGYVSHLSHVISYALAVAVLEKEKNDAAIFNLASAGFASTVRLAKSSVDMWLPIFLQNKDHILPIINTYLDKLVRFKTYLENGETDRLSDFIKEANKIRTKLEQK
jgi:prephenate dehydrogenase